MIVYIYIYIYIYIYNHVYVGILRYLAPERRESGACERERLARENFVPSLPILYQGHSLSEKEWRERERERGFSVEADVSARDYV
jgi:hypothetical protein